jgi:aspartyl-tRNA(Asn)/glutamyl-tRNA(Gln) amidotransferase subunit B
MSEKVVYEAVIGLEVHIQLATQTKMFCRCANRFGAAENTLVCPVCLGYPGTLPVVNRQAVDLAIKLSLALGASIRQTSVFSRKNYFYADLPKGYQISQFDRPLAEHGSLTLSRHAHTVELERLHLEEDAGKLMHAVEGKDGSLVDFNRCGVPLVEIVSRPDLRSADQAQDYLQTLHRLLLYTGTSDGNMEEGSLRCDANVSIRPRGEKRLGTRAEVKNLNSFRFVGRAINYEIERQIKVVEEDGRVVQETRTFDSVNGTTSSMRSKEDAHDYRYFPEPDLGPLIVSEERVEEIRQSLPELPWVRSARFSADYRLSREDAQQLTSSPELAAYYEATVAAAPSLAGALANWVKTEVRREIKERRLKLEQAIAPGRLAEVVILVDSGSLSSSAGKKVLAALWESDEEALAAAERLGLLQVRDSAEVEEWVRAAIAANPAQAELYRGGKTQLLGYFVGQVMRLSGGRAEPALVRQVLEAVLADSSEAVSSEA